MGGKIILYVLNESAASWSARLIQIFLNGILFFPMGISQVLDLENLSQVQEIGTLKHL